MNDVITPLADRFEAIYFDGAGPLRHPVTVELGLDCITVHHEGHKPGEWPYSGLRVTCDGSYGEPVMLEHSYRGLGETLTIEDSDFFTSLQQHSPVKSNKPPLAGIKGWPAVILTCLLISAIGSVAYFWGVSVLANVIATVTPRPVEERIGRAVSNIFAPPATRCSDAQREALLKRVSDRLVNATGSSYNFHIVYTRHGVANAFAAPGGYIVVFQGLLQKTETPEEYAAVLAHEITHVTRRHSMRSLARHYSAQTLLNIMAMDSAGTPSALEQIVTLANLSYQREDEEQADLEGLALLLRAGIQPSGLVSFFRRLHADPQTRDSVPTYFSSHPALLDRAQRLEVEIRKSPSSAQPLMTAEEWAAARKACAGAIVKPAN